MTSREGSVRVAIVDYGRGNLFSVAQACLSVGLDPHITDSAKEIGDAAAVIIPGVGAFGDAMDTLNRLDLVGVLRAVADSETPLLGICLGAQLLLQESEEFGTHAGLGIVPGRVSSFGRPQEGDRALKIPHVGWNRITRSEHARPDSWVGTLLEGQNDGTFMYFVHSYMMQPENDDFVLSLATYGDVAFCSGLVKGNVTALQFHPERSGRDGLQIYQRLAESIPSR